MKIGSNRRNLALEARLEACSNVGVTMWGGMGAKPPRTTNGYTAEVTYSIGVRWRGGGAYHESHLLRATYFAYL